MTETDTSQLRQELAERAAAPEAERVNDIVKRNRDAFIKLLGSEQAAAQFVAGWKTYMDRNPQLWECEPYSLAGGMAQAAQVGLSFGALNHVALVPMKVKGSAVATFIIMYRGIVELAYRSGLVKRIEANVVREGDAFDWRQGTRAYLDFAAADKPNGERKWTAVYALAELKSGGKPFTVLKPEDVEARRQKSAAKDSKFSPWNTNEHDREMMWEKSAVRDLQRFLPQTPALALALEADEQLAEPFDEAPATADPASFTDDPRLRIDERPE